MLTKKLKTKWFHYLSAFFAGVFFVNMIPHYINGMMGKEFPSPFGEPAGIGLSHPIVNVTWGIINVLISLSFIYFGKLHKRETNLWIAAAIGGIVMSLYVAYYFGTLIHKLQAN